MQFVPYDVDYSQLVWIVVNVWGFWCMKLALIPPSTFHTDYQPQASGECAFIVVVSVGRGRKLGVMFRWNPEKEPLIMTNESCLGLYTVCDKVFVCD